MRDFHQSPMSSPAGGPAGVVSGDGAAVHITILAGGAVMTPLCPAYEKDEFGGTKNEYKAHRAAGQGHLYAAGCP